MSTHRGAVAAGIATIALTIGAATSSAATSAAVAQPAAAKASGSLPPSCTVTIGETSGESYFYANKVSKWSAVALPKEGARHAAFTTPLKDDRFHYLAVTSSGRVYDSSMDFGGAGDGWDLDMLDPSYVASGSTIRGVIDLEVTSEDVGDDTVRPAKMAYAVTSDGRLHVLPMTYVKGRPRLGKPITLTAKGLGGLRSIEASGRYWADGGKISKNLFVALTQDGRLVELTVNRTGARPTLSYKVLATGYKNAATLALGWCDDKPYQDTTIVLTIDTARRVTALLDPVWKDSSLRGSKKIQLAPWKRGPANTLF